MRRAHCLCLLCDFVKQFTYLFLGKEPPDEHMRELLLVDVVAAIDVDGGPLDEAHEPAREGLHIHEAIPPHVHLVQHLRRVHEVAILVPLVIFRVIPHSPTQQGDVPAKQKKDEHEKK